MKKPLIITIGREFGSGGRELGRRLAEALSFEYYDREIIEEIANRTALSEEYRMLIRIAADGRIDDTEIRDFEGIKAAILDVIRAGYQVIYTDDVGIKKNRPEAGTSKRLMSDSVSRANDCKAIIANRRPVSRGNVSPKGGARS